jgi:hypothetical protein
MARNRPRNQKYLQGEVVGIRRPLRLYGRAEHGGQIPSQFDLKRLPMLVRGQHDTIYEAAHGLRGF